MRYPRVFLETGGFSEKVDIKHPQFILILQLAFPLSILKTVAGRRFTVSLKLGDVFIYSSPQLQLLFCSISRTQRTVIPTTISKTPCEY